MKLVVFAENAVVRRQIEDLLTSTPHDFRSLDLEGVLTKGALAHCDGLILDFDSWQRCVSLFQYFGLLPEFNQKPMICLSKNKRSTVLKNRNSKVHTGFCPYPARTEDLHSALQEMSGAAVAI